VIRGDVRYEVGWMVQADGSISEFDFHGRFLIRNEFIDSSKFFLHPKDYRKKVHQFHNDRKNRYSGSSIQ